MDNETKKELILLDLEANKFLRISTMARSNWGTPELQQFFNELLTNTRDGNRSGFPQHIWYNLLELSLMHEKHMLGQTNQPTYKIIKRPN